MESGPLVQGKTKVDSRMSRRTPLLTERIQEKWAGQIELLNRNELKQRLQPLRPVSPKVEGTAHSQLAFLVTQRLVGRLLKRVKELQLTRSLAHMLRRWSDLRLGLLYPAPGTGKSRPPKTLIIKASFRFKHASQI